MTTYFNEPTVDQYPHTTLNLEFLPHLKIHVITPASDKKRTKHFPLIVFVANDSNQLHLAPLLNLASHNFTIGIVDQSQFGTDLHQRVSLVKSAIRFLILHASQFTIDTNRVFLWGEQEGADLAIFSILTLNDPLWNNEDPHVLPMRFRGGFIYGARNFDKFNSLISNHKRCPLFIYQGNADEFDKSAMQKFITGYQAQNQINDALLENAQSGSDAFFTPYMLTEIENKIRTLL